MQAYSCTVTQMSKRKASPPKPRRRGRAINKLLEPRFFKALCDPNRVAIVVGLAQCPGPRTVSKVAECCPTDLSVVSRHLAMLREAGILSAQKRGKEVYYAVRSADVVRTLRAMADAIETCCPQVRRKSRRVKR